MIVTNVETVPGQRIIEHYGLVQGSTIRAKHIGRSGAIPAHTGPRVRPTKRAP